MVLYGATVALYDLDNKETLQLLEFATA